MMGDYVAFEKGEIVLCEMGWERVEVHVVVGERVVCVCGDVVLLWGFFARIRVKDVLCTLE